MKKIALLFIALIMSPLSQAADYKEGTDYFVISKVATKKPEVVEYFSFLCPACLRFEPLVADLKKNLPLDVDFRKNHTETMGGNVGVEMAKAYAVAHLLKKDDVIIPKIFNAIHELRVPMNNINDAKPLFMDAGISEKKFNSAVKSYKLKRTTDQMRLNTKKFNITGVPTFIINGKYQVNNQKVTSPEHFNALVLFLTQKKG
jgi:thiol:disulfide interchange protein DsbA